NLWIRQKLCNGSQCRHTDSPVVSSSFSVAMFSDDFDELLSRSFFFFICVTCDVYIKAIITSIAFTFGPITLNSVNSYFHRVNLIFFVFYIVACRGGIGLTLFLYKL